MSTQSTKKSSKSFDSTYRAAKLSRWKSIGVPIFNVVLGLIVAADITLLAMMCDTKLKPIVKQFLQVYFYG